MPDPQLKTAMAEIMEILKKHDTAALVFLCSKTHAEYAYRIDPSWSCAFFESDNHLRIRAKQEDYPTKEDQREAVRLTISMISGFHDCCRIEQDRMEGLLLQLAKTISFTNKTIEER